MASHNRITTMNSSPICQENSSARTSMWPVDYILNSFYSPLRLEQQIPNHQWRDAFEDLVALESNGEMISLESRKIETETGVEILYGKASHFIYWINRNFRQLARLQKQLQGSREQAMLRGDMTRVSRISNNTLPMLRSTIYQDIDNSKVVRKAVEMKKQFPASQLKQRGQWIASLISSGALPGWTSILENGPTPGLQYLSILEPTDPSRVTDGQERVVLTENMLEKQFGKVRVPEREGYVVENDIFGLRSDEVIISVREGEDGWQLTSGINSTWKYLTAQTVTSERILLPDGSTVKKVVLTNHSGNGEEEKIEITENTGKVLEEVEKARMLMQHEGNHWWSEYRRT